MKKNYLLLLISLLFVVQACDMNRPVVTPDEPTKSDYFDFATTRVARVSVNYDVSFTSDYRVLFSVYDQDPYTYTTDENGVLVRVFNTALNPIGKAFTNGDGQYSGKMLFPTHVEKVFVYSDYFGVPSLIESDVNNGNVEIDLTGTRVETKASPYDYTVAPKGWLTLGAWTVNGKPEYLNEKANIPSGLLTAARAALPEGVKVKDEYLKAQFTDIDITHDDYDEQGNEITGIEVNLVFLHSCGSYKNSVAYFTYPTGQKPTDRSKITPILAFPHAQIGGGGTYAAGELQPGDNVQLKYWNGEEFLDEFPKGVSIGFMLVSSGYDSSNGTITLNNQGRSNTNVFYSIESLNYKSTKQVVSIRHEATNSTIIAFEDMNRYSQGGDSDFNDVLFYVDVLETNAPPTPPDDPEDEWIDYAGTLAFEDLWPSQGDYDMNDLVIKYFSRVYFNEENIITKIEDKWTPIHTGATFSNAFGYQFGVAAGAINQPGYEVRNEAGTFYQAASQFDVLKDELSQYPVEKDQTLATYLLFEDANHFIYNYQTDLTDPIAFSLTTEFNQDLVMDGETLMFPPYNPFIITNVYPKADEGVFNPKARNEVHLPMYAPTSKVNTNMFGKLDDKSDPEQGLYYVANVDFPWAIVIPGFDELGEPIEYRIPTEMVRIDVFYPKFANWVISDGTEDTDWYLN